MRGSVLNWQNETGAGLPYAHDLVKSSGPIWVYRLYVRIRTMHAHILASCRGPEPKTAHADSIVPRVSIHLT